ncbi:uncharacterized protein Z519_11309 [Cladophialophora bantiana CBS 173.52]|uniref:AMP-binding enzyme n=1 Tax=Cladophialophora bantiana (strain ATCC 10958 / CBS 173.52 / CDC B-1940 / NIH 8579) TaxID=1442370 RepID=A0A0D2H4H7_CLAB1|nr:uncharacterized protein Z519_11309 [Cladophialophora bantiana CBS 173.52]KIW88198.1 hypothetical protein Z519_11309 [Cladophialophora bantiana CBS 173.52]
MGSDDEPFFGPSSTVHIPTKDLLSWIFDEAKYSPDEPIYIDPGDPRRSLSLRQAKHLIRRLIAGFRSRSLAKGDCICVHSFNDLYYSCVFLAAVGAGLTWTGTNPGYTNYELQHHLKASKTKLVIAQPDLYDGILAAAKSCNIPEENVLKFDSLSQEDFSSISWKILLQNGAQDWVRFEDKSVAESTTACILFSSGTTGLPKAACLSHYNLVAQHTLLQEQVQKPYRVKRILCLPFFHAAMAIIGHITPLRSGHIAYVMPRFQVEDFLRFTEKYEVTELFVVPPIIVSILQSPLIQKYSLRSLRSGMTGGAKIDLLSQKRFTALMHPEGCINPCYGMTELSCIGSCYPWPELDIDGSEVRAYNKIGEIWIRGPTVIKGYLDNPEANSLSFSGRWFHTGDVAYCDGKTKKWYIVDRKKELIKVRGFQVAPPELEGVLMSHPLISDAAVIGVPSSDPVDGELPRAYIVRRPGHDADALSEDQVKQYVAGRLAKYKQLNGGIVFVQSLPKTASGKYLKRNLRDLYQKEASSSTLKL